MHLSFILKENTPSRNSSSFLRILWIHKIIWAFFNASCGLEKVKGACKYYIEICQNIPHPQGGPMASKTEV
jgi:hypothetical protein